MDFEAMMKKMKAQYITDLGPRLEKLKELVQTKDLPALTDFFHKLKGSGSSYGLPQFSEYGAKYEAKAKEDALSDEDLKATVEELESLIKEAA